MNFPKLCLTVAPLVLASCLSLAQAADKPEYVAAATAKFENIPGIPECATAAVPRGDPSQGNAVLLVKARNGCVIPWHWHTTSEQLMLVSGRAKLEMKDGSPAMLVAGDFMYLVPKHIHQFTCQKSCALFIQTGDAPFDIHYVDAGGNEIPVEQALKARSKGAAKKAE